MIIPDGNFQNLANAIIEFSPHIIFCRLDEPGWPVVYVSRNVDQLGYSAAEFLQGKIRFSELIHRDDLERVTREVEQNRNNGADSFTQIYRLMGRDGKVRWIDDRTVIERNDDGRIGHYLSVILDITREKCREFELEGSAKIIDQIHDSVVATDLDGYITFWNRGSEVLLGYTAEEAVGRNISFIFCKEDHLFHQDSIIRPLLETGFQSINTQLLKKSGEIVHGHLSLTALTDESDTPYGMIGYTSDMTDRIQAETALRESERKHRRMVENLGPGYFFYAHDTEGIFTYISPSTKTVTGYNEEEFLKHYQTYLTDNPINQEAVQHTDRSLAGEQQPPYEVEMIHKDGHIARLEVSEIPIFDANGEVVAVEGIAQDITPRIQADDTLHTLVESMVGLTGQAYFDKVTRELCRWFDADAAYIGRLTDGNHMETISMVLDGENLLGYRYRLEGTLCQVVVDSGSCIYPHGVGELFPDDKDLKELGIQGYAGTTIKDHCDTVIAVIWVISRNPLPVKSHWHDVLGILAAKTSAELERIQAEDALTLSMEKFRSLLESTQDFVWEVDQDGNYTYCSPQTRAILGYNPEEMLGKTPFAFMPPDEARLIFPLYQGIVGRRESFSCLENVNIHKDGREVVLETSGTPFFEKSGKLAGFRGIDRDITERKRAQSKLARLATYDQLTHLPNRYLLDAQLSQRLREAARFEQRLALLFIDLDNFKSINDSMGHEYGDILLRQVAERISCGLRKYDILARFGGDEFVLVIPQIKENTEAVSVADKIIQDFTGVFELNGIEVYVSSSIGVSIFPEDGESASELLKHADSAMYQAKELGRNRYQFFTQAMNDTLQHHQEIAVQLRASIEKQDFQLFYQPQIDLRTGAIVSCEALIRWVPDGQRMIAPAEFISIAEKSNLINQIGEWVVEEACRQQAEWKRKGLKEIRIDINLSGRQFFFHGLWDMIRSALAKHGLSPPDIGIELTEHLLIQSDNETLYALQEMHDLGVHIAIDDFGTGYSSLSYLKRFPVNSLKIDREFVRDAPVDKNDRAIMEAIVVMGHSLGLKVLVEGIETEEQRLLSLEIQCDLAQGFFLHRPMAAEQIQLLLSP